MGRFRESFRIAIFGVTAGGELREAHPVNSPTMLKQRPGIAK